MSEPRTASTSPAGASDDSLPEVDEDDVVPREPAPSVEPLGAVRMAEHTGAGSGGVDLAGPKATSSERLDELKAELIAAELHRPAPQAPGYWPLALAKRKAAIVAALAVAEDEHLLGPPDPDAVEGEAQAEVEGDGHPKALAKGMGGGSGGPASSAGAQ